MTQRITYECDLCKNSQFNSDQVLQIQVRFGEMTTYTSLGPLMNKHVCMQCLTDRGITDDLRSRYLTQPTAERTVGELFEELIQTFASEAAIDAISNR